LFNAIISRSDRFVLYILAKQRNEGGLCALAQRVL